MGVSAEPKTLVVTSLYESVCGSDFAVANVSLGHQWSFFQNQNQFIFEYYDL